MRYGSRNSSANKIGRITPNFTIIEYPLSTPAAGATGIVAGADGALWFTEQNVDKIGRITTGGVVTEFPVPTTHAIPSGIAIGPDGGVWFTEFCGEKIGRLQ